MSHEEAERRERQLWQVKGPEGATLRVVGAAPMIDPAQAGPDERECVDIETNYGYGFGVAPADMDTFARAWMEHVRPEAMRAAADQDPELERPVPKVSGCLPEEPKGVRTHASNARYAEKVRAVAGTMGVHDVPGDSAEALRYLTTEDLRALWHAAHGLIERIEAEGRSR